MVKQASYYLDKSLVKLAFEKAAENYNENAVLQHEVNDRMADRLSFIKLDPEHIVDIGAGTGKLVSSLRERYQQAKFSLVDLSHAMLAQAKKDLPAHHSNQQPVFYYCGDAESLPLTDASADVIVSNLTLQWCNDLGKAFSEFYRVLKPGGLLMFSTFGPQTLHELKTSWSCVDDDNHINDFIDMHDIGDALVDLRMADPVMDSEHFTLTYDNSLALMKDIKAIGAHNVTLGRHRGLTGKNKIKKINETYEQFRMDDGRLPATYEVIYGHCWKPLQQTKKNSEGSTVTIPVSAIKPKPPAKK